LADRGDGGRARPQSVWLLSLASTLSPFGMIVVVPALGAVGQHFGIGTGEAQLLIAAYLFGLGVGQPVAGTLSDRLGRRPVILAGFVLFSVASAACALAPTFGWLVAARFLQALGVCVGTVGARAIVRDTHDAIGAARALTFIGAAMGIAPVIGPAIGGALGSAAGHQAVFAASAVAGVLTTFALRARLAETLDRTARPASAPPWPVSYGQLLRSPPFMGYTLMYAFTQGCFFAFLAVGAAVFEAHLGLGPTAFGLVWAAMGFVYVLSAASTGRLTARFGTRRLLLYAGILATLAGTALALATGGGTVTAARLLLPLLVLNVSAGIQSPLSIAGAVNCRPDIAGTASGLSSSLALGASGAFSIAAGTLYAGEFTPVALLIAFSAAMTLVTWRVSRG